VSDLPFDTHLMLSDPLKYAPRFIEAGSDILSFHAEVLDRSSFAELRTLLGKDVKMGLAIKPRPPSRNGRRRAWTNSTSSSS